jgi:hypothetical protein
MSNGTYETKDSGVRAEYKSGMVRDTQEGKARFDLMRPKNVPYEAQFLTRVAQLMTRGIGKYGLRNWEHADSLEELERFEGSAERHLHQYLAGDTDEDHAAAVVFNLLAAETTRWKMGQGRDTTVNELEECSPFEVQINREKYPERITVTIYHEASGNSCDLSVLPHIAVSEVTDMAANMLHLNNIVPDKRWVLQVSDGVWTRPAHNDWQIGDLLDKYKYQDVDFYLHGITYYGGPR